MTNYEQDLAKLLQGKDPDDVRAAIGRHLDDIEQEKEKAAQAADSDIAGMTDDQLEDAFTNYDHANPDYRYNIKHPSVKRHNAVAAELTRRERVAYAQSQQVTMDKTAYLEQEARRIDLNSELANLHANLGVTLNERNANSEARAQIVRELEGMVTPDQLTEPPSTEPPPPTDEELRQKAKDEFWEG